MLETFKSSSPLWQAITGELYATVFASHLEPVMGLYFLGEGGSWVGQQKIFL